MANKRISVDKFYELRKKEEQGAWARVGAWVILKDGMTAAKVQITYPRDGAGKLKAFCVDMTVPHATLQADPMTGRHYGWANGGGYDKATAAIAGWNIGTIWIKDDGAHWYNQLADAGYVVVQAV